MHTQTSEKNAFYFGKKDIKLKVRASENEQKKEWKQFVYEKNEKIRIFTRFNKFIIVYSHRFFSFILIHLVSSQREFHNYSL